MPVDNHVDMVAEVGSNHGGDLDLARAYIAAVAAAGADAVKFQSLDRDRLVAPEIYKDGAWVPNPVHRDFANVGIPDEWCDPLRAAADAHGVEFMSTPFHLSAVDALERAGVRRYKIASGDITFFPLLERVGSTGKPVLLSTGASTLDEVDDAVEVLQQAGAGEITVLHCVAIYPPEIGEMNLRAITTMYSRIGLSVGISDHTVGELVPLAAVALGATVVEKHVTFDRGSQGPDHPFATTLAEYANLVDNVRKLESALGTGDKVPTAREAERRHRFRRSRYDRRTLRPGPSEDAIWLRPEAES